MARATTKELILEGFSFNVKLQTATSTSKIKKATKCCKECSESKRKPKSIPTGLTYCYACEKLTDTDTILEQNGKAVDTKEFKEQLSDPTKLFSSQLMPVPELQEQLNRPLLIYKQYNVVPASDKDKFAYFCLFATLKMSNSVLPIHSFRITSSSYERDAYICLDNNFLRLNVLTLATETQEIERPLISLSVQDQITKDNLEAFKDLLTRPFKATSDYVEALGLKKEEVTENSDSDTQLLNLLQAKVSKTEAITTK